MISSWRRHSSIRRLPKMLRLFVALLAIWKERGAPKLVQAE